MGAVGAGTDLLSISHGLRYWSTRVCQMGRVTRYRLGVKVVNLQPARLAVSKDSSKRPPGNLADTAVAELHSLSVDRLDIDEGLNQVALLRLYAILL